MFGSKPIQSIIQETPYPHGGGSIMLLGLILFSWARGNQINRDTASKKENQSHGMDQSEPRPQFY